MIDSICLKNYKAFEDVTIPIKPLTILLGANSVGKSSIIQMLMLLHQTSEERGSSYASALKIYGNYVNVGAFENLFKEKKTDKPLSVSLSFCSTGLVEKLNSLAQNFFDVFRALNSLFFSEASDLEQYYFNTETNFSNYIDLLFERIKKSKERKSIRSYADYILREKLGIQQSEIKNKKHASIRKTYEMAKKLSQSLPNGQHMINDPQFRIEYAITLDKEKNKLIISSVVFYYIDNTRIISCRRMSDGMQVESDLIRLSVRDKKLISDFFNFDKTIFDCLSRIDDDAPVSASSFFLNKMLYLLIEDLIHCVSGSTINYVSPLRAHPKRYYMLDKAKMTISLDTLDGDAIAEVLKDNTIVKLNVNNWFNKFGFKIDVKGFKEVIHHLNVTQNGLSLDITDVGFGISQVLPIIIQGFLSMNDSITIIEQPEIHLHPMMQAELGDLFIDITKNKKKKLIIETHSEYLLKRIRRRISEGEIAADMVSICLFHPKSEKRASWVEVLDISDTGAFAWPEEFYGGELYNDTVEFLKHQV